MDSTASGKPEGGASAGTITATGSIESGARDNDSRQKLMNDMKTVIGEAETWLKTSGEQTGAEIGAVKQKFEQTLQSAKSDLSRLEASVLAKSKEAAQATDAYVQENPWKSVTIGATVGLLLGLAISRN
jgi:ElaB/YqjD/DUF883 family membrane-anchored ribosome-binding protein